MSKRPTDRPSAPKPSPRRRSGPEHGTEPVDVDFPVVGIGASAGGLEACRKLLAAIPDKSGMALILVQHLDPHHESMMAELLASHTTMTVQQATDGMPVEPDHLYIIPPGRDLAVRNGALHLSSPQARHGARLPFDFLLQSLAEAFGMHSVCVILSGTGADGSLGLKAVKEASGLVIVQDPTEAAFDGMPRSAVMTGAVDLVLPVADIPKALADFAQRRALAGSAGRTGAPDREGVDLSGIVDLLRAETAHDFRLYKHGTLQRRIERRMALASIDAHELDRYLDVLKQDPEELQLLAKDLLINVTAFFRDPAVFDYLADEVIPGLVRNQSADQPLRIWVVGCSTGQEAYSLAMLFREQISAAKRNIKLQVFASDVDPEAVASARDGLYPRSIEAEVSPERLARFFTKEEDNYRVSPDLRASVVFTVQDLLADPPFSRLDLVSCRNLLIYLQPEAQARAIALFHFALNEGGLLMLGSAETVGDTEGRYEIVSKKARIYRRIGRSRPGDVAFSIRTADGTGLSVRPGLFRSASQQANLVELCRQLVLDGYAPAAVLINASYECLYFLGPADRYLRIAPGHPTHDLLAMTRDSMRTKLRSAIQQARQNQERVSVYESRRAGDRTEAAVRIDVQPVSSGGAELFLICFVDQPARPETAGASPVADDVERVTALERELTATKTELQSAIRSLEISNEEQKAINEEALSVNEEFQSTNEELLTSKEELQSLNEELSALNGQLQETLEQQRTTSNDLQNVLYSTDVATLFLDPGLKIRFFTPATKALFNIIPGDVGRPLADLNALAPDADLLSDSAKVLQTLTPLEREIEADRGTWYNRRIMPYRTLDNRVEGVVITFIDVTERRRSADALKAAKLEAEQANQAKSRFLAAASHDLRQPLQTLALLQGQLESVVTDERAQKLITLFDQTVIGMSDMLNTLLDLNQIEAGVVRPTIARYPLNDLLMRLHEAFAYGARSQGSSLRVVPCSLPVLTDPKLLEQMLRNLLSNALKYTQKGKVLLGCRRFGGKLRIEVWDNGPGIPEAELQAIFQEYHQIGNPNRHRSLGLGLGLSIVHRLSQLLDHPVSVRSTPGKGSMFGIEVDLASDDAPVPIGKPHAARQTTYDSDAFRDSEILVIEDEPDLSSVLKLQLTSEGYRVKLAADGPAALEMLARKTAAPDILLTDLNLPNGMDGLQTVAQIRRLLKRTVPAVILTGDISVSPLRDIDIPNCLRLNKPVRARELGEAVRRLLADNPPPLGRG